MKVKILGYTKPIDFDDIDEVRWSSNSAGRDPYADRGKRVLYVEPGTEFLIDNRSESDTKATNVTNVVNECAAGPTPVSAPVVVWQGYLRQEPDEPEYRVVGVGSRGWEVEYSDRRSATGEAQWLPAFGYYHRAVGEIVRRVLATGDGQA